MAYDPEIEEHKAWLGFLQPVGLVVAPHALKAKGAVLTREPQQLKTAATRAIVLTGLLMTAAFASQELAGQAPPNPMLANTWPALMAWLPIFIFGPISVILLDKVKT